jgi:hypothetical protein
VVTVFFEKIMTTKENKRRSNPAKLDQILAARRFTAT